MMQVLTSFERLSLRERLLLLLTLVVAISMPTWVYIIEPLILQKQALEQRIVRLEKSNAGTVLDLQALQLQRHQTSGAASAQLLEMRAQLAQLNEALQHDSPQLISSDAMMQLLQEAVLAPSAPSGLQLLSLSKPAPAAIAAVYPHGVYQHQLTLVVSGNLAVLKDYLETLEGYEQPFFWDGMELSFTGSKGALHQARLTLRLHTLSTERGWLAATQTYQQPKGVSPYEGDSLD